MKSLILLALIPAAALAQNDDTMYSPTLPPTFEDAQCYEYWCEAYSDTYGFSIETNDPSGPYGTNYDPPEDTVAYTAPEDTYPISQETETGDPTTGPADPPAVAPEINPAGAAGGLTLLLGIAALMRDRRRR